MNTNLIKFILSPDILSRMLRVVIEINMIVECYKKEARNK